MIDPPTRHRLGQSHFDALAAGRGDEHTVSELLSAERSWRRLLLRALLDEIRSHPDATGPLPPAYDAWQLLVQAERQAPSEVETLLLHPQAGTWASYTLRRLRGSVAPETPLWVDVGYLHAIAAAAAIRAKMAFSTAVPVRAGYAVLPTMGSARLPETAPWTHALVSAGAEGITIRGSGATVRIPAPGDEAPGWTWLRTIRTEASGHVLSVNLDDVDPYRSLRTPHPPEPLTPAQIERWRGLLAPAWRLIVEASPDLAAPLARGLFSVVPHPATERFRMMSASAGDAFGSMIMSEPEDAAELAVTLVHEFQHIKLGGLLHLTPLHDGEPRERLYAPWRDDPRPLSGLLQGVYAFVGITDFWCAARGMTTGGTARLAQFEFARWREPVWATLQDLAKLPQLTDTGRRLIAGLTSTAESWRNEPVPAELLALARAAAADHRTRWRIHHLRPDPASVAALAAAWAAGKRQPDIDVPAPVVDPDASARWLDARAVLALWRLTDSAGFADLERNPSLVGQRVTGATAADLAFVAGDLASARASYLAAVSAEPDRVDAWAGLGLTQTAGWPGAAAQALATRPELVRAAYRHVLVTTSRPADPLALAEWLGSSP